MMKSSVQKTIFLCHTKTLPLTVLPKGEFYIFYILFCANKKAPMIPALSPNAGGTI